MTLIGFVVHPGRAQALETARAIVGQLRAKGFATRSLLGEPIEADETSGPGELASGVDLVVSVGGDGTFLRAAKIAFTFDCPVLGVKVGRMGFLTETEPENAPAAVAEFLDGRAVIEPRMAIVADADGADGPESEWALNEVIVEKIARHKLIRLAVGVDGERVTTFSADGVIVSTPTGSTAYSFSARGPIVSPALDCLIVTPIAAHMVFDRSLVLSPQERVTLEVVGDDSGVLSADGRESVEIPVGASVRIGVSPRPCLLVRRKDGPRFLSLVRDKFGLPGGETV